MVNFITEIGPEEHQFSPMHAVDKKTVPHKAVASRQRLAHLPRTEAKYENNWIN